MAEDVIAGVEWVKESHLVGGLGVSRNDLRRLRGEVLEEGLDWRHVKGRGVLVSPAGVERLRERLKAGDQGPGTDGGGGVPAAGVQFAGLIGWPRAGGAAMEVRCWVAPGRFWNAKLLPVVFRPGDRRAVGIVRVKATDHFRPGMELVVSPVEGQRVWRFVSGPRGEKRMPRWRGKW